MAKYHLSNI